MNKILTIVVPTYNAEKYLRDNLDSFRVKELFSDIEVLIVNDGSTDRSLQIANEYVEQYPDVYRVITKENGGHGSGINCGIQYAAGKYFKVVDADDWVEKDAFTQLVQCLKTTSSDVIYSGFLWAFDRGEASIHDFETKAEFESPFADVIYNQEYEFDQIARKAYIKMHNLTIKTAILKQHMIPIDEHCYYVDSEYITYPIPYVNTITFLKDFVYRYRIGTTQQSVSIAQMQKNEKHYDKVIHSLLNFYSRLGKQIACSDEKKAYLAGIIARVIAGKYKIMLSGPCTAEKKSQLVAFDKMIKRDFHEIYLANCNRPVSLLRLSGYTLYGVAGALVKHKYR